MKPPHDRGSGKRHGGGGPRPGGPPGPRGGGARKDGGPRNEGGPRREGHHGGGHHGGGHHVGGQHGGGPRGGGPFRGERRGGEDGPRPERLSLAPRPEGRSEPRAEGGRFGGAAERDRHQGQRPHGGRHQEGHHHEGRGRFERRDEGHRDERMRAGEAPRGALWLYGIHAVAAALANPARRLRRLVLTDEAEAAIAARLPQPWPVQPERSDRARIDQLLGRDAVHQGAALLADPLAVPPLAQALERPGPVVVLDQVSDPRNIGAILRSAAAFGAAAVITQERNAPDETGALAKAASGALEKVPLFRAVNIARTLVALKAAGLWCVGLDAAGPPLSGPALGGRRIALVLGAEGEGLRRLTRETCDEVAGIAMPHGHESEMESLNVSAAAAIALYEAQRRG